VWSCFLRTTYYPKPGPASGGYGGDDVPAPGCFPPGCHDGDAIASNLRGVPMKKAVLFVLIAAGLGAVAFKVVKGR
jgi:hypothetical protein